MLMCVYGIIGNILQAKLSKLICRIKKEHYGLNKTPD